MTFSPTRGNYSIDEFNSSVGATPTSGSLQNISNGYVTLLSALTGNATFVPYWNNSLSWTLEDNLYSVSSAAQTFTLNSGEMADSLTNTVSGEFGTIGNGLAFFVRTEFPELVTGVGYSGRGSWELLLDDTSPNTVIADSFNAGTEDITFEFDVSSVSTFTGQTPLSGFSASGINLTGLPSPEGFLNHGLLFCNGREWDYIEVSPFGLRSYNHPELAVPGNFFTPKKVRVGFRGSDIFLATEDGVAVAGYNKFTTAVDTPPISGFAAFGAPGVDSTLLSNNGILTGIDGIYGVSIWDNIKVLTGEMAVFETTGVVARYTTVETSLYTDEFDPRVNLNSYLYANVGYVPYVGGETKVSPQFSGENGWETLSTTTLTPGSNTVQIDLGSFPVSSYPREDATTDYLSNPIRFKIDQRSYDGSALPPAVEFIEVFADSTSFNIDLVPDWKEAGTPVDVKFYMQSGLTLTEDPKPEIWTSLLYNTPNATGVQDNSSFTEEANELTINVVGKGETVAQGRFGTSLKNFVDVSGVATAGSEAELRLGGQPLYNFFPNPLFAEGFRPVISGENNYFEGKTDGEIAADMYISRDYTGSHNILYESEAVYRPEAQARVSRINSYLGRTSTPGEEYVQSVTVYPNTTTHDGTAGIEAAIPSGIASGQLKVSFDLQITQGSGLAITVSGDSQTQFELPAEFFRGYQTVSFPATTTSDEELRLLFAVPAGYSPDTYQFSIDNLTVSKYQDCYLEVDGVSGYTHISGIAPAVNYPYDPERAATVFNSHLYLHSYPAATATLLELTGVNGNGISITVGTDGYLTANIDTISNSWGDSAEPNYQLQDSVTLTSESPVPVGRWTSVSFLHDTHTFSGYSNASASGDDAWNFAATNKAYLGIDGYPVASYDMMSGWRSNVSSLDGGSEARPFLSYVDLTGSCTARMASGLLCQIDAVKIDRPPVADFETDITIKGARSYVPYMVPDNLFTRGTSDNVILTGIPVGSIYTDLLIGSCYNFSSPGYPHFDNGGLRNHLLVYGAPTKVKDSPYGDLFSTRFVSGDYAVAPYSSSYERLQNTTGQAELDLTETPFQQGTFRLFGWAKFHSTGTFLTLLEDHLDPNGSRAELSLSTGSQVEFNKYNSSNTLVYSNTGQQAPLSGWTFVNVDYYVSGQLNVDDTVDVSTTFSDENGYVYADSIQSVAGAGIRYRNSTKSQYQFGGEADVNLFNWVLPIPHTGEPNISRAELYSASSKSGMFQPILLDNQVFNGAQTVTNYYSGIVSMPQTLSGDSHNFGLAMMGTYHNIPPLQGIVAYDNKPFVEVPAYQLLYNTDPVAQAFGNTNSPIRLGNVVPSSAINIARISSPNHTVSNSIATIDLSDSNTNNLVSYRNGTYDLKDSSVVVDSELTGYKGINEGIYSGRGDITISGQVLSADIQVSTLGIADSESQSYAPAYYYYLVGRGDRAVRALGTFPHYTGQISEATTGESVDNYIANLQRIKQSISLRNAKGESVSKQAFPYDIHISPYTPDDLLLAVQNNQDIYLDNIGDVSSGQKLPDTVFSVIMVTEKNYLPGQSVFVHYDSYDITSQDVTIGHKEVVNPQPIFREKRPQEGAALGMFSIDMNESNYYDLKLYGFSASYTGQI